MEGRGRRVDGRARAGLSSLPSFLPSFLPLQERPLLITAMGEEEVRIGGRGGRERSGNVKEIRNCRN